MNNYVRDRLKVLGLSLREIDKICNLDAGTTKQYILHKITNAKICDVINECVEHLSDQQDELTILATDIVLENVQTYDKTLFFLPTFATAQTYTRSGYAREYGTLRQFNADIHAIFQRITNLTSDIYYFTPFNYRYIDSDIFAGFNPSTNKAIIDPLKIRHNLKHETKGDKTRNDIDENVIKQVSLIYSKVSEELEYYHQKGNSYPKVVCLPAYLSKQEYLKRNPKLDLRIYNQAIRVAVETCNEFYRNINFVIGTHEDLVNRVIEPDVLVIDVLRDVKF